MSPTISAFIDDLTDGISVLQPDSNDYEAARAVWNGAVDFRPAAIVQCRTADDVSAAVRAAVRHQLDVTVRGAGHDWNGRALRSGGVVLDLRAMNDVSIVPTGVRVGAGATGSEVLAHLLPHGKSVVTGTVGGVGFTGFTIGGGYGRLMGQYGLGADNLVEAEVVLADGSIVVASDGTDPDLFWALRGGGGNFGVVTAVTARTHPAPFAHSGLIVFPLDQARNVLAGWRAIAATAASAAALMIGVLTLPDVGRVLFLSPSWTGSEEEAVQLRDTLSALGSPLLVQFDRMPIAEAVHATDALLPTGRHYYIQTRSVLDFSDAVVDAFLDAADSLTSPFSALNVHHFHGAATEVDPSATAVRERREHFLIEIIAAWDIDGTTLDAGARHRSWADRAATALDGDALEGGYINLLGADDAERVNHAFGENVERLRAVKRAVDPHNVFTAPGALA